MTPYEGQAKIVGPLELRVDVRIDDLDIHGWRGEIVGTRPVLAPGFKAGYATVILLDDPRSRLAGAIASTTEDKTLILVGDDRFA